MEFDSFLGQPSRIGYWRDYILSIYGPTFTFALGSMGGILAVWLICRGDNKSARPPNWSFGWAFAIVTALLGIAAHPTLEAFGVAQICGQSLILLGCGFVAARYLLLPLVLRYAGLAGCILDCSVGILLHFKLETLSPKLVKMPEGILYVHGPDDLSMWAVRNAWTKEAAGILYLGDHVAPESSLIQAAVLAYFILTLWAFFRAAVRDPPG